MTIDFRDLGRETEIVLVHTGFPNVKERDDHTIGWAEILSQLAGIAKVGFGNLRGFRRAILEA